MIFYFALKCRFRIFILVLAFAWWLVAWLIAPPWVIWLTALIVPFMGYVLIFLGIILLSILAQAVMRHLSHGVAINDDAVKIRTSLFGDTRTIPFNSIRHTDKDRTFTTFLTGVVSMKLTIKEHESDKEKPEIIQLPEKIADELDNKFQRASSRRS
jgi:membrane protein YdbS with pleckstrin-like domain